MSAGSILLVVVIDVRLYREDLCAAPARRVQSAILGEESQSAQALDLVASRRPKVVVQLIVKLCAQLRQCRFVEAHNVRSNAFPFAALAGPAVHTLGGPAVPQLGLASNVLQYPPTRAPSAPCLP